MVLQQLYHLKLSNVIMLEQLTAMKTALNLAELATGGSASFVLANSCGRRQTLFESLASQPCKGPTKVALSDLFFFIN